MKNGIELVETLNLGKLPSPAPEIPWKSTNLTSVKGITVDTYRTKHTERENEHIDKGLFITTRKI